MKDDHILPVHSPTSSMPNSQTYPPVEANGAIRPRTPDPPAAYGVARLTVHIPSAFRKYGSKPTTSEGRSRPRWNTLEFRFYYVVALIAISVMVWIPISLSQPSHPNYRFYSRKLSEGWIYDQLVDNSDAQYRSFRNNMFLLCKAAFGYLTIKFIGRRIGLINPSNHRLYLIPLNVVLSLVMIVALHGASALKILLIMALNFLIPIVFKDSPLTPLLTWAFNGGVLFLNEIYHGYLFDDIAQALKPLDAFTGAYPRWHVMFNITMLRLISFNMDYYWACKNPEIVDPEKRQLDDKHRVSISHDREIYSLMNYVAYVLYPPLYIAGPIITFNDFMWQHRRPLTLDNHSKFMYLLRFFFCYITMEYILHFMYVVAIKDTKAWAGNSPAEIAMIGFWNLIIVWLKLLIPWRFFRAWALLDGVDPPENMVRCMANNYSAFGFWRSWHRSYNLWIIRYIYVPLGGNQSIFLNTLLVFTFVALWHDLTFKLLAWGWLVSLFVVPEMLAAYFLPASKYGKFSWYRHVCAIGGVLNILMMMTANLVGFVVGTDGVKYFFSQLLGSWEGIRFMILCSCCIFIAVQLMFEYREEELRQGIVRRC